MHLYFQIKCIHENQLDWCASAKTDEEDTWMIEQSSLLKLMERQKRNGCKYDSNNIQHNNMSVQIYLKLRDFNLIYQFQLRYHLLQSIFCAYLKFYYININLLCFISLNFVVCWYFDMVCFALVRSVKNGGDKQTSYKQYKKWKKDPKIPTRFFIAIGKTMYVWQWIHSHHW